MTENPRATHRRSKACGFALLALGSIGHAGWSSNLRPAPCLARDDGKGESQGVEFTDVAADSGLIFEHFLGSTGEFFFPEISSAGVALFDYDNDGDLDVYLLQGNMLNPDKTVEDTIFPPRVPLPPRNRLFRNELIASDGRGTLRFIDVTAESGTGHTGYAQGVATGDVDNDGHVDLFVTNLGPDVLYINQGDGTFREAGPDAGLADPRWNTSASFLDFDRDGFLDLFVAAYAEYSPATDKDCQGTSGRHDYCGPSAYQPVPDRLYRNQGDGTFENVSQSAGLFREYGHALGIAVADFDANGWPDIYVANDGDANQLWMNEAGQFKNAGLLSGAAVNGSGQPEAGMGVAMGDFDGDGDDDLFVAHLAGETNTLYENLGDGYFCDRTARLGLGAPSRYATAFGTVFADFDHNGKLDLFIANGAVSALESQAAEPYPYRQPNQLMLQGERGFVDVTASAGAALALSEVSRGVAAGDIDNDGDVDIVVTNSNGPVRLLRNDLTHGKSWLGLRVIDDALGRDAIGASVRVKLSDGTTLHRLVHTDTSYCSANDARVHFAWPAGVQLESVSVTLPNGMPIALEDPEAGQLTVVRVRRAAPSQERDEEH